MRISRLELHGFKSFPDRTSFQFGPGISCVVGPNGSGKSNVVDALKWCVGEQSARSLRGADMSDVIFAGSVDRKPVGFAEVVLTLVASEEQPFPGEYAQLHELQVGRRLHRSGTSEYFVNQTRVRRRDVVDLLMDSGIGNNLYSFIEQGQVDKMITASASERRSLIDEAAGISRYKARRDESQERMVATSTQLDRAADVVDEMTRHLRVLEQQVLRAARFRSVRARIRQHELHLALAKHHALAQDRRALRQQLDESRVRQEAARREIARREEDLAERREELRVSDHLVSTRRDEVAELDARIREQEATAVLHGQRSVELEAELVRARAEVARAGGQVADAAEEATAAEREGLGFDAERDGARRDLDEATRAWEVARSSVGAARSAVARAEEAVAEARTGVGVAEAAVAAAEAAIAERVAERQRLEAGRDADRRAADEVVRARELLDERLVAERARAAVLGSEAALADERLLDARAAEAEVEAGLRAAERARDEALATVREAEQQRAAVRDRGIAWLRALEADGAARIRALDRAAAEQRRTAAEDGRRLLARALDAHDTEARERGAAELAEREGAVAEAVAAVTAAERTLRDAQRAARDADALAARNAAALVAREAERDALARTLEAVEGDRGTLGRVLGSPRSLLASLPAERRAEVTRVLGDRASWVVVRDPVRLDRLRREVQGELSVWFWPDGTPPPSERVSWTEALVGPVEQATSGPGFWIEPTGAVHFGGSSRLTAAAARADEVALELGSLGAEGIRTKEAARAAAEAVRRAVQALARERESEASARRALREHVDAASRDRDAARRERERELREAQSTAQAALERELAARRDQEEREAAAERTQAEQALAASIAAAPTPTAVPEPQAARAAHAGARAHVSAAQRARDEAREALARQERALLGLDAERVRLDALRHAAGAAAERTVERETQVERALEAAREAALVGRAELERARALVGGREEVAAAARAALEREEAEVAARAAARTALELLAVGSEERGKAARQRAAAAWSRRGAAVAAVARAEDHVVSTLAAVAAAGEAQAAARRTAVEARETRGAAWDALERARAHAQRVGEGLAEAERQSRQQRTRAEALERAVESGAESVARVQQDLELLRRSMEERYQVSLSAALDRLSTGGFVLGVDGEAAIGVTVAGEVVEPVVSRTLAPGDLTDEDGLEAAVEALEELRAELALVGEVNLGATAEYRELAGRVEELSAQRADLEHALEQIRQAIARLNRECRERFRDTFDRVNEYFQETYPRLVGGGSARLSLTDDEDLLDTGVDIFVQPPGKRLQNLQLLSGGEKAMTAIALLIALFRVKPSPFCVLDEVDAPLDEANGARFNDMLREMSQRSQFLVITHNRKTMECADTLYGITMARHGVSRLVSVNLGAW